MSLFEAALTSAAGRDVELAADEATNGHNR
jgi:hypothetical protein